MNTCTVFKYIECHLLKFIIAEAFETDNEKIMDTLINRSETFKHYINFDKLKIEQAVKIVLAKLK